MPCTYGAIKYKTKQNKKFTSILDFSLSDHSSLIVREWGVSQDTGPSGLKAGSPRQKGQVGYTNFTEIDEYFLNKRDRDKHGYW